MRKLKMSLWGVACAALLPMFCSGQTADAGIWKTYCDDAIKSAVERRFTEAEQFIRLALAVAEKFGNNDPRLTDTFLLAGRILSVAKRNAEAEPHLRQALALTEARLGSNHLNAAECNIRLGVNLTDQRKFTDAEPFLKRAEHIVKWKNGGYHPTVGTCQSALARNHLLAGRYDEADKLYAAALRILGSQNTKTTFTGPNEVLDTVFVPNYRRVMQIRLEQAQSFHGGKKFKDAEEAFKKLVKLVEDREGKDSELLITPLLAFAVHYADVKKYSAAEALLLRRQLVLTQQFGLKHPEHISTMVVLERVYRAQDKIADADRLAKQLAEAGAKPASEK